MMSILSNSNIPKNNTMTLIQRRGLSSLGPNTTLYGEESLAENGEIEELHYLMVRVEKMKKTMLGKVEGRSKSVIEQTDYKKNCDPKTKGPNENDAKEELLYQIHDLDTEGKLHESTHMSATSHNLNQLGNVIVIE